MKQNDRARPTQPNPHREDALAMCRQLRDDLGHARRVAAYATTLFDACAGHLHQDFLSPDDLFARLSLAAWLHDIGKIVAFEQHQEHSRYLVENSAHTRNWDAALRADVAALCAVHRRRFRRNWRKKRLRGQLGLLQMAALLRIADGLDRSHETGVTILASMERDALYLKTHGLRQDDGDRLLSRKADVFEDAFDRPLVLFAAANALSGIRSPAQRTLSHVPLADCAAPAGEPDNPRLPQRVLQSDRDK